MAHQQIAIDGPAGTGKSTVAKRVAEELGYTFVDTGALYRCVALAALRGGVGLDQHDALGELARRVRIAFGPLHGGRQQVFLDGEEATGAIRERAVDNLCSPVSAVPAVRAALLDQQRAFAVAGPVVMEGRDIQTVVLPAADVKVFLTASPQVRALRRFRELPAGAATLAEIEANVRERDERDSSRALAPLRAAADAVTIDTDTLTIDEVVARVVALARARGGEE
jgi:cytidylate kinase